MVAPYSRQAVGQLRALGLRVVLLTSDSPAVTGAVAREVTFDEIVTDFSRIRNASVPDVMSAPHDVVAFVGGPGDSTLASADLGIVTGCGSNMEIEGAGVVLPGDLRGAGRAIVLARAIVRTMRVNVAIALAYNALVLPLVAFGWLPSPGVLAAAGTTAASMAVMGSSLMLLKRRLE
jgi:Cu+-exporting ATPase